MKLKTHIIETTFLKHGWGNGYVIIPEGSKLHGKSYDEIHDLIPNLEVHGGLTFSALVGNLLIKPNIHWKSVIDNNNDTDWIVGFDTSHYKDNSTKWTKERVQRETESLKRQLETYEKR